MAGKYHFRPDKQQTGLWHKLYITPKQRAKLLKWTLYAAVLLAASVVQDVVLSRMRLYGATTDLVPCALFLICLAEGSERGGVFVLAASVVYLFSGSAPGPYVIPFLTVIAISGTIFRQSFLQQGFAASALCTAVCLLLYEISVFAIGWFLGLTPPERIYGFLITTALTLIAIPVFYPLLKSISTIGGDTWKD